MSKDKSSVNNPNAKIIIDQNGNELGILKEAMIKLNTSRWKLLRAITNNTEIEGIYPAFKNKEDIVINEDLIQKPMGPRPGSIITNVQKIKEDVIREYNGGIKLASEIAKKLNVRKQYVREIFISEGWDTKQEQNHSIIPEEIREKILMLFKNNESMLEISRKFPEYTYQKIKSLILKSDVYEKRGAWNKKELNLESIEKIIEMRTQKKETQRAISKELDLDRVIVNRILSEHGLRDGESYTVIDRIRLYNTDIISRYNNKETLWDLSKYYNCSPTIIANILRENNIYIRQPQDYVTEVSDKEKEVCEFVESLVTKENVISNDKEILRGYQNNEIDILIPSKKLGIEFDGLFWHSEIFKDHYYHLEKTTLSKKMGINLIHIFEDEWKYKQDIVKSILKAKLGKLTDTVYARECDIRNVDCKEEREFLNNNHLQNYLASSYCYGLYYQNDLKCLVSFVPSRYSNKYNWELLRFANKINLNVVGGFSKLISHFKKNHTGSIVTFADKRYSTGTLYEKTGFKLIGETDPNYYYFKNDLHRESRQKYQKQNLQKLLPIFDPTLTEWENMRANGYNKIYDCGNMKFLLE